ncbi:MAG: thioredoxin family protein [Gemmatimonadaceae bacterium]
MHNSINHGRRRFITSTAATLGAARLGVIGTAVQQMACAALSERDEGALPSLDGATQWLNSPPLTPAGLRGKVVLVDFWTYTCVNWLRTLPYVRAWGEKYRDQGLVVIGVHTPEFPFEKNLDNVRWAAKEMDVNYPIAVDSDYSVWRAFDNNYWPAVYVADANGRVRYHHFGEGAYDETEKVIQRLLGESGRAIDRHLVSVAPHGLETAADYGTLRSPESYLGYEKAEAFAGNALQDAPRVYTVPPKLALNQWALAGDWTVKGGSTVLNKANGQIAYQFHARDVNLIMGPPPGSPPVRFTVTVDGQPPGAAHGADVDQQGNGTAARQTTYQLIRQQQRIADRKFEIQFEEPGVEAFCFTFG